MNMFLAAGAVVAVIVIAAAFMYSPPAATETVQPPATEPENQAQLPSEATEQPAQTPAEVPAETPQEPEFQVPSDSRPDLELSNIKIEPMTPLVNELITFVADLKNAGGSEVTSFSFTMSPLIDQVSIISAASAGASYLAPGDSTTIRMQAKISTPGPTNVKSTVDTFNNINESNETNNQLVVPFRIYTKQSWAGCYKNGKSVCANLVDDAYFLNHTECQPAYNCTSSITGCDAVCPFPR